MWGVGICLGFLMLENPPHPPRKSATCNTTRRAEIWKNGKSPHPRERWFLKNGKPPHPRENQREKPEHRGPIFTGVRGFTNLTTIHHPPPFTQSPPKSPNFLSLHLSRTLSPSSITHFPLHHLQTINKSPPLKHLDTRCGHGLT
jgi:hypothetical protein